MEYTRASGILLHPTSLPGLYGIGDLGPEAYRFVDFLISSGQSLWQVLPLGPTGYSNSPYQSFSAFAGNPLLISLELLQEEGLLSSEALSSPHEFPAQRVDYSDVIKHKVPLLRESFDMFLSKAKGEGLEQFESFCQQHASWLEDYALFMALKDLHAGATWNQWEKELAFRVPEAIAQCRDEFSEMIDFQKYLQYQFFKQWGSLKSHCNRLGIRIIGDIPIYVAHNSADVWTHPELFNLDDNGEPTMVAGVPPDYFSATGQLWGNPIYRWDVMADTRHEWWIRRFRITLELADIVRLDHFRGYEGYWEVPAGETTAVNGRWVKGLRTAFFDSLKATLGELPIIAEDLGVITPEVVALRDHFGFPGMRVLQFAFSNDPTSKDHQPHNYLRNCIVYTGTHDNNTTVGWFDDLSALEAAQPAESTYSERATALKYLGADGREVHWDMIRVALASGADMAIIPLQDVLGLGSEARMNRPATSVGNWEWRFTSEALTDEVAARLGEMTRIYGRVAD